MGDKTMRDKNEKDFESTSDEIMREMMKEIGDEVKQKDEEEKASDQSGSDISGDDVDHPSAADEHKPVKKHVKKRKKVNPAKIRENELTEEDAEDFIEEEEAEIELLPDEGEAYEEEELDVEGKALRRQKRGKIFKITALSVAGVIAALYLGFAVFFMSHFYFNTKINGVDFSMKSIKDVETYMEEQVKGYTLTLKESDGDTEEIVGSDIALAYKEGEELEKLVKGQNAFLWPSGLWDEPNITASVGVEYDKEALAELLAGLKCMKEENQIPPVSAIPEFDGNSFVVKKEETGTQIDAEIFETRVNEYIAGFRDTLDLTKEGCYIKPKYTSKSKEVEDACTAMNKYLSASITYTFGSATEVVDKSVISKWLTTDENMAVVFSEDAVSQFIQGLADKYNTYQKQRSFTSGGGNSVTVEGGDYGWIIDKDTEYQALLESIKSGETVTKEPAYSQTAASHEGVDWGSTYVEVDLTNQYVYLFVNGSLVISGPVVTGKPSAGDATPQGVYSIKYCQRNATLRGPKKEDGSYEWESPVSFWMPFNGGIGLHDAPWQSAFGGDRYLTYGSHGCVNLQYNVAETIYNNVQAGTPVVCHY